MTTKQTVAVLTAGAAFLSALTTFTKQVVEIRKDQAFAWDNFGDQVGELERLRERVEKLEKLEQVGRGCGTASITPQPVR